MRPIFEVTVGWVLAFGDLSRRVGVRDWGFEVCFYSFGVVLLFQTVALGGCGALFCLFVVVVGLCSNMFGCFCIYCLGVLSLLFGCVGGLCFCVGVPVWWVGCFGCMVEVYLCFS